MAAGHLGILLAASLLSAAKLASLVIGISISQRGARQWPAMAAKPFPGIWPQRSSQHQRRPSAVFSLQRQCQHRQPWQPHRAAAHRSLSQLGLSHLGYRFGGISAAAGGFSPGGRRPHR